MADSAIGYLLEKVDRLASFALGEATLVWGVKEELHKLRRTLDIIRAVIVDAEVRQSREPKLRIWIEDLTDVLYDSENVLDEFECEALRKQVIKQEGNSNIAAKVRHFFSCSSNPVAFRLKMAHRIKVIRQRLDQIQAQKDAFNLNQSRPLLAVGSTSRARPRDQTHSYVSALDVIGRDTDRDVIVEELLNNPNNSNSKRNPLVISIVGMGGLGKTTLAKLVYNDDRVKDMFGLRIWVCVSEDFSLHKLLQKIITTITKDRVDHLDTDSLQARLRELLQEQRFLLVLDDVWNDNDRKWSDLRDLLKAGVEGSYVVVTTRSLKVASAAGTNYKYELKGLSESSCVSLLMKGVFEDGQDNAAITNPKLLKIASEIAEKCRGVPLVVQALSSVLRSKIDENFWKSIRDKDILSALRNEGDILPIMRLSFDHLPHQLKRCFIYSSLFPKDHKFINIELASHWIANGLVDTSLYQGDLEDVADQYIQDLLARSFFHDVDEFGVFYSFKMHDLIHDLALSISYSEYAVANFDATYIPERVRHVSFRDPVLREQTHVSIPAFLNKTSNLRTIYFQSFHLGFVKDLFVKACISKCKYLRFLDLSGSNIEVIPNSIGTLKHLRCLGLKNNTRIKRLPESICDLHCLQLLSLYGCEGIEELPRNMWKLISLRSLIITTKQKSLKKTGIQYLKSLRYLGISKCPNLESLFEGMDMKALAALSMLSVDDCSSLTSIPGSSFRHLISLENLLVSGCKKLDLSCSDEHEKVPHLSRLRFLCISDSTSDIPKWVQETSGTLQCLILCGFLELAAFPEWLKNFTHLEWLIMGFGPNICSLPTGVFDHLTALKRLEFMYCGDDLEKRCRPTAGEDWHKIAHIPYIFINGMTMTSQVRQGRYQS